MLIVRDILKKMEKLGKPEIKSRQRDKGLKSVEFGLSERDLGDLVEEVGVQPLFVFEKLWDLNFYECRALTLRALPGKYFERSLVEKWGPELEDRSQAHVLAERIEGMAFVSRRLLAWLSEEQGGLRWVAEEWLWLRLKRASTDSTAKKDLERLIPRCMPLLAPKEGEAPGTLSRSLAFYWDSRETSGL